MDEITHLKDKSKCNDVVEKIWRDLIKKVPYSLGTLRVIFKKEK